MSLSKRGVERCRRGDSWTWDGVRFEILNPGVGAVIGKKGNASSCVMRVSVAGGSVLFAADIDRVAEADLVCAAVLSPTTVVVAPHHGSHSSSGQGFVAALMPRWVLYSVGYRNRFGHPHAEVIARYAAVGAEELRSDRDGAVRFDVGPRVGLRWRWRDEAKRYWLSRSSDTR